ncbi:MAG: methyltransferase [Nitrososphaeraceae archaeon]
MLYLPSDDTIFLANTINRYSGTLALEIGTSNGIVLMELAKQFKTVIGTDIDFCSLKRLLEMSRNQRVICCHAASALHGIKFDLIVTNPPYLPNSTGHIDNTTDGGPAGVEITIDLLKDAIDRLEIGGKFLIIVSSISDTRKLDSFLSKNNIMVKKIAQKELFYETLQILELSK